jgi:hypothetical protein
MKCNANPGWIARRRMEMTEEEEFEKMPTIFIGQKGRADMTIEEIVDAAKKEIQFWMEDFDGCYPPMWHSINDTVKKAKAAIEGLEIRVKEIEAENKKLRQDWSGKCESLLQTEEAWKEEIALRKRIEAELAQKNKAIEIFSRIPDIIREAAREIEEDARMKEGK